MIEEAQCYKDHKAQDTMINKEIMNWTPDVLYSGYGPTRHPNNGNQGTKPQRGSNLKRSSTSGSGQPAGTNRSSSSNVSGSYRPNNSNHKGQGKHTPGFKSGNDHFSHAQNSGSSETPICFAFNQYEQAFCELPNNQCNHQQLRKCQTCGHWGCKSCNHSQHKQPPGRPQTHVATCDHENFDGPISLAPCLSVEPNSDPDMQQMFNKFMQSMITSHMEKVESQPQASAHISGPDPTQAQALDQELGKTYGLPAVALPNYLSLSKLHLGKKNILWTHITFAGVPLPPSPRYLQQFIPS